MSGLWKSFVLVSVIFINNISKFNKFICPFAAKTKDYAQLRSRKVLTVGTKKWHCLFKLKHSLFLLSRRKFLRKDMINFVLLSVAIFHNILPNAFKRYIPIFFKMFYAPEPHILCLWQPTLTYFNNIS